jgi:chromosome segregation ATPase
VKITEQFGDNFKYLNEAVGQLLTWQQQYKSHVEATAARHDEIVRGMKEATQNFSLLSGEASSFSKTASDLSSLMSVLESQKQTLQKSLDSLGNLLTAASGALPEIQTKIVEIARQLSVVATQSQKIMTDAITENARRTPPRLSAQSSPPQRNRRTSITGPFSSPIYDGRFGIPAGGNV